MLLRMPFLLVFLVALPLSAHSGAIEGALKEYLEEAEGSGQFWVGCEPVRAGTELKNFYIRREYRPVWVSERGPRESARELAETVGRSGQHGLSPNDYHHACLSEWMKAFTSGRSASLEYRELAGMEILLSDAFLTYGHHLAAGKVDTLTIHPQWLAEKKKTEVVAFLEDIETSQDVRAALEALAPSSHSYLASIAEAKRLRALMNTGGVPAIPGGKTLRKGDQSVRVALLRERLFLEGDLLKPAVDGTWSNVFDSDVEKAVIRFQRRHGLSPDGAVGRQTLTALNRSPKDRIEAVFVNMERWRWLPRDLGKRHILINTAAFMLESYRDTNLVLEMPVIVGETYTMTPVFSKKMTYLEINPYWNVPHEVLSRKILPKIKKDPGYLTKNHFELIRDWKDPPVLLDLTGIDWSKVHQGNFPGRLRQKPGPWNALGQIKFMFPNPFSVYLHDTPERHLFQRSVRMFSSGCIRVDQPLELALFVLENDPSWDRNRIENIIKSGKTTVVPVRDSVMVHLLYWTFWVGQDGQVHYRDDIYGRDGAVWEALNTQPGRGVTGPGRAIPERDPNVGPAPKG